MAISTYLANKLLDHFLAVAAYSAPTVWVALSTTDPASVLTEPSGTNAYARVALAAKFSAAANKASPTTGLITFPTATNAGWGTVGWFAICDNGAIAGGNVLWSDSLSVSKVVSANDTLSFSIGNLSLSFS